jgi:hypothetical protein
MVNFPTLAFWQKPVFALSLGNDVRLTISVIPLVSRRDYLANLRLRINPIARKGFNVFSHLLVIAFAQFCYNVFQMTPLAGTEF